MTVKEKHPDFISYNELRGAWADERSSRVLCIMSAERYHIGTLRSKTNYLITFVQTNSIVGASLRLVYNITFSCTQNSKAAETRVWWWGWVHPRFVSGGQLRRYLALACASYQKLILRCKVSDLRLNAQAISELSAQKRCAPEKTLRRFPMLFALILRRCNALKY